MPPQIQELLENRRLLAIIAGGVSLGSCGAALFAHGRRKNISKGLQRVYQNSEGNAVLPSAYTALTV